MNSKREKINRWIILSILFALVLTILILSYFYQFSVCPFELIFGVSCPGCGITRATILFLSFRFYDALVFYPLLPLTYIILSLLILSLFNKDIKKLVNHRLFGISMILIYLITYVIRYIYIYPNPPFTYNYNSLLGLIISATRG